ncbi:sensor histidine kinase [Cognatishimia sp. SS12]|uniref:sensor histidine kinase n=1 Tax=Cognatishimia sp. SS12 TaxID=2979465 RepID=UPI00232E7EBB|nr:sensor histidine kinase [Cognatishimia sp. SS12]MDC0736880.1 sensor histidine kinase [Cognatishimia sp. SS12]
MTEIPQSSGSLSRRLTLQLMSGAAILATMLYFVVLNVARDLAETSQDNILFASATAILEATSVQGEEVEVDIPYGALSMLGNVSDDRVFYRISVADTFLTGYRDLPQDPQENGAGSRYFTDTYKGESVRAITVMRRISLNAQAADVAVTVAQTRTGQMATVARMSQVALISGAGFFTVAAVLAVLTARSAIRPLNRLAGSVSRRGPKDMRPVIGPVPSEMVPLVTSLNRFMARLKTSLTRSEDFIAEAAHRVRTPLATVRTQAEVLLRRVDREENRHSLREMIRAIDESSRAAGQLLDHAMVTYRTDHLERERIDLAELVRELVARLQPVAELKDLTLVADLEGDAWLHGDAILIQNAVRNILDNAIKYSPRERKITVSVKRDGESINLQVTDEAGGFPTEGSALLTERFARGQNSAGTVGSGLGLTIAKEVAEAHGGSLILNNTKDGGGACVTLQFV